MLQFLLTLACSGEAPQPRPADAPLPSIGARAPLDEQADGVAAADLDGDGVDELFFVRGSELHWSGGQLELGGGFQRAVRGDTDGDGKEEALIATGMVREQPTAPARIWRIKEDGAELIYERASKRGQVPELRVVDGRIWTAGFVDSLTVEAGWVEAGELQPQVSGRLATRSLPLSDGAVVLARVYGANADEPGDLAIHRGDQVEVLPSFRGARALALGDLDGDGQDELLSGDGWHKNYGQTAIARLQVLPGTDWQDARALAHLPLDYSIREIEVLPDGRLLVTGTRAAYLLTRDSLGWAVQTLGPLDESGNVQLVQTADGPAVLFSGKPAALVSLGS